MTPSPELHSRLQRSSLIGFVLAVVAGAACALGYIWVSERFYPAYLTAFVFWLGLSLGCLFIAMVHGLTGGAWGRTIRRVLEAGYETLPLMAVAFVPLALDVGKIYPWADPQIMQSNEMLLRKADYLNVSGFHVRAAVYFGLWIVIVGLLDLFSPRGESGGDTPRLRRLQLVSGLGLVAYGFSLTLAAVDWVMSLEPAWYSTMYGLIYIAGQAVSGLALALVVIAMLGKYLPWTHSVTPDRLNELGNLMLAGVMFWAYCTFFQYLVIWSGNLPEENVWYLRRSGAGWQYVVVGLVAFHFAVPFLLLLSRRVKRDRMSIARVAALLLVMRYVDVYWIVVPGFEHASNQGPIEAFHWLDLAALVAIGGAWSALFAWRLSARMRVPVLAPELMEVVH